MDGRQLRLWITGIQATLLGLEIIFALTGAWITADLLRNRQWGWAVVQGVIAGAWTRWAVQRMVEINRHGIFGRPQDDREDR